MNNILPMLSTNGASDAKQILQERQSRLVDLKHHLPAAQNRMKLQADKRRSDRRFQVGDRVLLKLQPYVQQSVVSRPYPKLALKYYGPYEILEKLGAAAYKLNLPEGSLIHPVFHVSQLKLFTPNYSQVSSVARSGQPSVTTRKDARAPVGEEGESGHPASQSQMGEYTGSLCDLGRLLRREAVIS
jgi:hypothetical protein